MTTLAASPVARGAPGVGRRFGSSSPAIPVLQITLVLVLLLQRFALPVGTEGISITLAVALVVLSALVLTGQLVHDLPRLVLFALSVAVCGVVTWISGLGNVDVSLGSFLLLAVVYVPWVFRVPDAATSRHGSAVLANTYVTFMVVAAVVAVLQLVSQLVGVWVYHDPLAETVPQEWLLSQYNTSIPTEYASPIYKSQAFVFLEPSFLSQFLALALIVGIVRRVAWWKLLVLGLAMFCTYSGTGIVLLALGLLIVLFRTPRRIRPGFVVFGVVAVAVIASSPFAAPLLGRTSETSNSGSSLSLRFVQPYQGVVEGLADEPERYLVGAGPGSAERLLENDRHGAGLAVVYTIVPKVYFEYGLVAGSAFLAFLGLALYRRPPAPVVPGALVIMLGLLSGSLLQPHTLLVAWLLTVVWGRE